MLWHVQTPALIQQTSRWAALCLAPEGISVSYRLAGIATLSMLSLRPAGPEAD